MALYKTPSPCLLTLSIFVSAIASSSRFLFIFLKGHVGFFVVMNENNRLLNIYCTLYGNIGWECLGKTHHNRLRNCLTGLACPYGDDNRINVNGEFVTCEYALGRYDNQQLCEGNIGMQCCASCAEKGFGPGGKLNANVGQS